MSSEHVKNVEFAAEIVRKLQIQAIVSRNNVAGLDSAVENIVSFIGLSSPKGYRAKENKTAQEEMKYALLAKHKIPIGRNRYRVHVSAIIPNSFRNCLQSLTENGF